MFATVNVDSGGVVGGPDSVLSQAGVVTGIIQPNSLDMQTAIPPHWHILVWGHLTEVEWNPLYSTQGKNQGVQDVENNLKIEFLSVSSPGRSCAATASRAADSHQAARKEESSAGPRSRSAQPDSSRWRVKLWTPFGQVYGRYEK